MTHHANQLCLWLTTVIIILLSLSSLFHHQMKTIRESWLCNSFQDPRPLYWVKISGIVRRIISEINVRKKEPQCTYKLNARLPIFGCHSNKSINIIVGNPFCLKPDKILDFHIPRACMSQNLVQQTKKLFFDWQSKLIEKLHLMYQIIE